MSKLYIDLFAEKHLGREQELNEDSVYCLAAGGTSKMSPEILAVLGVADGMGGPDGGVVASSMATEYLTNLFVKGGYETLTKLQGLPSTDHTALITEVFQNLNRKIRERFSASPTKHNVGTTFTFGVITYNAPDDKTYLHVGNVGNSRCYIIRGDQIFHATEDDSHAWQLYKKGEITYAEMLIHPMRHASTTIGMNETVSPQVHSIELLQNDIVLFCTDGLHDNLEDAEIEYVVNSSANTRDAVKALVASAKAAGGNDDIAIALGYCSASPMELHGGFAGGLPEEGMTGRKKALIGVSVLVLLLCIGAVIAYVMNPWAPKTAAVPEAVPASTQAAPVKDTLAAAVPADSVKSAAAETPVQTTPIAAKTEAAAPHLLATNVTVPPKEKTKPANESGAAASSTPARGVKEKLASTQPEMTIEWNAQTKRFRIQVKTPAIVPTRLSYGDMSFDVVAVKTIPNLYKTTTPADAGTLPAKGLVTVTLKGAGKSAVTMGFSRIE